MRGLRSPFVLLLLTGCAAAPAPSTPPPPDRPPLVAHVSGEIAEPRGGPASGARVTVFVADRACTPQREVGATADERGQYHVALEGGVGPDMEGCVVVEAFAGGARGRATAPATFRSANPERVVVNVRLGRAPGLTLAEAERLAGALREAINGDAMGGLASYTRYGEEGSRVAIENYRIAIGEVQAIRRVPDSLIMDGYEFELIGTRGNSRFYVIDDGQHHITGPLIESSWRAFHFLSAFARLVVSGDAQRLAAVLTADDIDYPVEKAEALIARMRTQMDFSRSRFSFVGIDESRSTLRYAFTDGTRTVPVELGYGDGLLWLRE